MWLNGTRVITQRFDAANQVNGFTYDAAGNLTNDGNTSYAYDALNRLLQQDSTVHRYNGDDVLIATDGMTSTQDLVALLSQILNDGDTTYFSGLDRLANADGTWELHDALGSVRFTVNADGSVLHRTSDDPWGQVETGSAAPFGFTGELQSGGLVNLRARWYATGQGRFVGRDPFAGVAETPYSQHEYQYGYSDPILQRDPSGRCIPVTFKQNANNSFDLISQVLGLLAEDDCQWIWQIGQGLNTGDGASYAQAIADPAIETAQAIYQLATDSETQQAFIARYSGPFGQEQLKLDISVGFLTGIYDTGKDLLNGVVCHDPNQFGRGLSRIAINLAGTVLTKIGIKAISAAASHTGQLLGKLKIVAPGEWRSTAGLIYGPHPRDGNVVRHILRHAVDDVGRVGVHGVFDAGSSGALSVIDEAWEIVQRGGSRVQ